MPAEPVTKARADKVVADYIRGMGIPAICTEHRMVRGTVQRILHAYGILGLQNPRSARKRKVRWKYDDQTERQAARYRRKFFGDGPVVLPKVEKLGKTKESKK